MTDNFRYAQLQAYALAGGGAIAGATSIILKSMTDIDGTALTMSGTFGAIGFGTLEPGNGTLEEQICFTGLTTNANGTVTLSGVSNVSFVYPYTQTSGLSKTHAGSVTFVISNTSGFYDKLTAKADDETITGLWTFPDNDTSAARIASDVDTAVATAFVTLGQLSRQAISGASNASTTVKGIVQLPTQAQTDAKTATGSTGAALALTPDKQRSTLLSDYVADTGAADAYAIAPSPVITAYATGQRFTFKATNTNTTVSTLAVNGLTTKTIKKNGTASLIAGDILATQLVEVEYDGTNFQLMNPSANAIAFVAGAYPAANGAAITNINGANITAGTIAANSTTNLIYQDFDQSDAGNSSTSEITVYTFTINGGVLGTGGLIRMQAILDQILTSAGTGTIRFKYGATTMVSATAPTALLHSQMIVQLGATGATNAQSIQVLIIGDVTGDNVIGSGTAVIDSTTNQTFAITIQYSSSNANNRWRKRSFSASKL